MNAVVLFRYICGIALAILPCLLLPTRTHAQIVDPKAVGGTIRCITAADTLYEVQVDVQSPTACPFTSYTITWDALNRSAGEAHNSPGTVSHRYRLTDFIKNCGSGSDDGERLIKVVTDCKGDNKSFSIFFKLKPVADFQVADACENRSTAFTNRSCPQTSNMTWRWNFGDGTTSSSPSPSKVYSNTATSYTATLSTTNECGTSTRSVVIPIRKTPEARIKVTDFNFQVGPTTVTCLGNGGRLTMDATTSLDGTSYQWTISPSTFHFVQNTNASSPVAKVEFTQAGDYTITLIARNDCGQSTPVICPHRVEELPTIQLTQQPDSCVAITYRLRTTTPSANFALNGQPILPNQPVSLSVSTSPYIVRGELNGQCGMRVVADTFFLQTPQPVLIGLTTRPVTLCAGSAPLALAVTPTGGNWAGTGKNFVELQAGSPYFNPSALGRYALIYERGIGTCRRADTVQIEVQGGNVKALDQTVCAQIAFVKLQADLSGGRWSSTTYPAAIRNDTLFMELVTANSVEVAYELTTGSAGCPVRDVATITIGRPRASFLISGVCSNTAPIITNTSLGAGTFRWSLNNALVSASANPTIVLPSGQSVLSLTASSGTCFDTTSRVVRLVAPPAPISFQPSQTTGCSPLTVTFSIPTVASPDVQYRWALGNGITNNNFSPPPQTYTNSAQQTQTIPVSLSAQNGCGVQSFSTLLTVRPLAKAEIGVDSTTFRCSPARVKFANRSTGQTSPATWLWGDGTIPLITRVDTLSHLFSARDSTQNYRIQLIASSECGRDTTAVSIRLSPPIVRPLFTLSNSRPCNGETVQLRDATVPKPERWFWRFGDGQTSTLANPQIAYPVANKAYTITLVAYTACGYDSIQRTITTQPAPVSSMSVATAFGCTGLPVQFVNRSDPSYRFVWNFGDGSAADSVQFSPVHIYPDAGSFMATLTVFGMARSCQSITNTLVRVRPRPVADFTVVGALEACSPFSVQLLATGIGGDMWQWYLSDGQQQTGQQPTLSLRQGTYDIKLKVSYGGACADSTIKLAATRVLDCVLRVPDAFSPGGYNPRWTVFGEGIEQLNILRIWSRWGEVIYEVRNIPAGSLQPADSWDGTFQGVPMPAGLYPYETEVVFKGGKQERKVGTIRLLR